MVQSAARSGALRRRRAESGERRAESMEANEN
jgi:hypothetical protein